MFEQDYIMRQIKECLDAAMRLLFHVNVESPALLVLKDQQKEELVQKLTDMLDGGKVREAVSELDSATADGSQDDLIVGYRFYTHLCQKDDDFLELYGLRYSDVETEMKRFFSRYISSEVVDLMTHTKD
ncbi:MAG: DUF6483 family protein [Ruminococcus sp.]|nr:DUF6483 family protein [Ruminococcus sp.]